MIDFQSDGRILVELFQSVVGQDAILIHYGHNICRDGHGHKVEQRDQLREGYAVVFGKSLHELEAHAASAEMLEGVGVILTLGVEDGHCRRHHLVGHVVVADNEVYALFLGISYLLDGLDTAIEDDDKFHTSLLGIVYSFLAHTISFVVSVGDIVFNVGIETLQEFIHQRNSRASIYIVVAVHHDALLASHCVVQTVHGHVHILHQEGIDEVVQLWTEVTLCRRLSGDASAQKDSRQQVADTQLAAEVFSRLNLLWCRCFVIPFEMHLYRFYFLFL